MDDELHARIAQDFLTSRRSRRRARASRDCTNGGVLSRVQLYWRRMDIRETSQQLRRGKISPVELTRECLRRIEQLNPTLNAFITVTEEAAIRDAQQAELEIHNGHWRGPLHGIPVGLKDLIDTAGVRTTAASRLFAERIPAEDADVVTRLKEAGAISSASRMRMNSRTVEVRSSVPTALLPMPGTRHISPVVRQEDRQPRWPPAWATLPSEPTPQAPSANPPPYAVLWD